MEKPEDEVRYQVGRERSFCQYAGLAAQEEQQEDERDIQNSQMGVGRLDIWGLSEQGSIRTETRRS